MGMNHDTPRDPVTLDDLVAYASTPTTPTTTPRSPPTAGQPRCRALGGGPTVRCRRVRRRGDRRGGATGRPARPRPRRGTPRRAPCRDGGRGLADRGPPRRAVACRPAAARPRRAGLVPAGRPARVRGVDGARRGGPPGGQRVARGQQPGRPCARDPRDDRRQRGPHGPGAARHAGRSPALAVAELEASAEAADRAVSQRGEARLDEPIEWWGGHAATGVVLLIRAFETWTHADDVRRAIGTAMVPRRRRRS